MQAPAIDLQQTGLTLISSNIFETTGGGHILVQGGTEQLIAGNSFVNRQSAGPFIDIIGAQYVGIHGNTLNQEGSPSCTGVYLNTGADWCSITGNVFSVTTLQNTTAFMTGVNLRSDASPAGTHNVISANTGWPNNGDLLSDRGTLGWANTAVSGFALRGTHLQLSVADTLTESLGAFGTNSPVAFVFIIDSGNRLALFTLRGTVNATQELQDPSNAFSGTADTNDMSNVYYSSANGRYEIQNKTGAPNTYSVFMFGPN